MFQIHFIWVLRLSTIKKVKLASKRPVEAKN